MWDSCGMSRNKENLEKAIKEIQDLRAEFWKDLKVTEGVDEFNQTLEAAGRTADFLEFGETMCRDALHREESCGGHFREEHQTSEGEAKRNDEEFAHVSVWEYTGENNEPNLHKEELAFENVKLSTRSYK